VLYLPVLIALAVRRISKPSFMMWCLMVSGAASFALLLTLSRASWIGFAAAMTLMALLWDRRLLVVFALLAVTHTYWLPQEAVERVEETTASSSFEYSVSDQVADDSTQMRIEQYKSLPSMMAPKPIFGWGYHSFPRVFERHGTLGRAKGAHSTYCLIATEEGIVGLIVFGTLLVLILRTCVQAARRVDDKLARWMAIGLACATVGAIVAMAGGERFEAQIIWVYFWIMLAVVERQLRLTDEEKTGQPTRG
jgi:O-antigen ligase